MAGVNKVILIGNLGRDPEIRYSQQGSAVCNFSIATSEEWMDKNTNQKQERTEWHNIVVFGKTGEACEKYLKKGSRVYIEGKNTTSTYDKEGQTHYSTKVQALKVEFLSGKQDSSENQQPQGQQDPAPQFNNNEVVPPEEDIPF